MYLTQIATAPPVTSALFSQRHTFPFCNTKKNHFYHGLHLRFVSGPAYASISRYSYEESGNEVYDPELRRVLELATDSELYEIERILFGPSYFSPLLKSVLKRDEVDCIMIGEDPDEREDYISMLESRFMFLAADARSTLRGWRPSYRSVLLEVRKKLKIPCSAKLSAEDLEAEIFLHLLQEYSSEEEGTFLSSNKNAAPNSLELGLSQWKVQQLTALGIGAEDIRSLILKGGGMLTIEKMLELLGGRFSGKLFTEAAKYQIKKELMRKGGTLVALNLESRAALLAARQGLKAAATRYLGLRSITQLFGPLFGSIGQRLTAADSVQIYALHVLHLVVIHDFPGTRMSGAPPAAGIRKKKPIVLQGFLLCRLAAPGDRGLFGQMIVDLTQR